VAEGVHFRQGGDAPALVGAGDGTLACGCGHVLIEAFHPAQFLGVGIQCARCGAVTTTDILPAGKMPPDGLSTAEPSTEPRLRAMKVPAGVAVVGRAEMDRLGTLLRPVTPPDTIYRISADLLDQAAALFEHHAGGPLPAIESGPDVFAGLGQHALAWAVRHLRARISEDSWGCTADAPTANAVTHVAGFLHFVATWSRHPLFPAMVATAADSGPAHDGLAQGGFSLHGLALFAAAHAMALAGNRVGFQQPTGYPGRIEHFNLATGATETVRVQMDVFDRFAFPFGRAWDPASLRAAVSDTVAAAQGRINLRNPGVLLLSPGSALDEFDKALTAAVKAAMQGQGRQNRGLMAVAPIVLRLQPLPDPHAVRLVYGLFPIANRHFGGPAQG
jgi:hypothetical protein